MFHLAAETSLFQCSEFLFSTFIPAFFDFSGNIAALSSKRVVLTLGTFELSFLLKAYVVSRKEIHSFKFSGPGSYYYLRD